MRDNHDLTLVIRGDSDETRLMIIDNIFHKHFIQKSMKISIFDLAIGIGGIEHDSIVDIHRILNCIVAIPSAEMQNEKIHLHLFVHLYFHHLHHYRH